MKELIRACSEVMCAFEIPVFKYISTLWTRHGYSLVAVLCFSELVMAARCVLYALIPRHRQLEDPPHIR